MEQIPDFLKKLLLQQYGNEITEKIILGYGYKRVTTLRVNTLRSTMDEVKEYLDTNAIAYQVHSTIPNAILLPAREAKEFYSSSLVTEGKVYFQSLSSMLPPLFLDPKEGEILLDMAAAPGGKTTEMAALTNNKADITAIEVNKIRSERLKHNVELQGCTRVYVMNQDAKRLDDFFSFDRILLDAPCSGSGTLDTNNKRIMDSFSYALVKNSAKLQLELLEKAIKILKKGHEMIYSTCSILSMENEEILQKILAKGNVELVPIQMDGLPTLPTKIPGTLLVLPNAEYEGFFVAKLKRIK